MTFSYHPEFPRDIKKYEGQYRQISGALGLRFRTEVEKAIEAIKSSPGAAGHFLNTGSQIVKEVRRRNLTSFPFFVLYGVSDDVLVFRSVIPSAADPLTWLKP
jgi:hypothetical protein